MRTSFYIVILSVVALIQSSVLSGCVGRQNEFSSEKVNRGDTLVREMALSVYSDPDSIARLSRKLLSETEDSVTRHYLNTMLAFSSILMGDRIVYDSLTEATGKFTRSHPEEALLNEFYHRNRAVVFNLMGMNDSAYAHMSEALASARSLGQGQLAVENEAALGDFAEALGELPLAISHMRRAVAMADSANYTGSRSFAVSLGSLYASMGNFDEADKYFDMHRSRMDSHPPYINFFYYLALGNRYYYQQDYESAAASFREALALIRSIDDISLEGMTEVNLGECMLYTGKIDSAVHYINAGIRHTGGIGVQDKTQRAYMESLLGDVAMMKGDYAEAGKLLMSIDTLSLPPKYRMLHFNRVVEYLKRTGDYRDALGYRDKALAIERKLHAIDTRNYAAELDSRYMQDTIVLNAKVETSRKEEEVLRLRQWIYLVIAIVVVLGSAGAGLALYNANRRRKAIRKMQQSLMGLRLETTRNRMAPHFIFNVLNAELDIRRNRALMRLINLIRRNLELAEKPLVPLNEELEFVKEYVEVKCANFGDDFELLLEVGPGVDISRMIPSMFIQIFVENAVKHGLMSYPGHKILGLFISHEDGSTRIVIVNNGRMESPAEAKGTGTGLRIVSQTIHTLNAVNSQPIILSHSIEKSPFEEEGKCYKVQIVIPDDYDFSPLAK